MYIVESIVIHRIGLLYSLQKWLPGTLTTDCEETITHKTSTVGLF